MRVFPSELNQRIFLQLPLQALLACSRVCRRWRRSATLNYAWYRHYLAAYLEPARAFGGNAAAARYASLQAAERAAPPGSTRSELSGLMLPPLTLGNGGGGGGGGARWTRRESRTDWKVSYAKRALQEARDEQRQDALFAAGLARTGAGGGGAHGSDALNRSQRLDEQGVQTASVQRQEQWRKEAAAAEEYSKKEARDWYKQQGARGGKVKGKRQKGGVKTGSAQDGGLWE